MPVDAPWTCQLDNLLLEALQGMWRSCNRDVFHGVLLPPVLALDDTRARLGQWHGGSRRLSLSRPLVRERPWRTVREVMKHEMAHQYVDEILGVRDEAAHGACFVHVCAQRHIDARASSAHDADAVVANAGLESEDERVMRRVQKLLALAGSSNVHEAEAAANAAQRLMLEHNIAAGGRGARVYATRALSAPALRLYAHERILAGILAQRFFVEIVIAAAYLPDVGRDGSYVEALGTHDNLAMAEWIYHFLLAAAERECRRQIEGGAVVGKDRWRFLTGFVSGVAEKLAREAKKSSAEGLVWIGDPDLKDYVRLEYPRLSSSRLRMTVNEAHARGRVAGNNVVIARPVSEPVVTRGRLLIS